MPRRHGKETVVYIDGYDVSGYSSNFGVTAQSDVAEVTGFGDARKRYVLGHQAGVMSHAGWFDDSADGIHEVIEERLGTAAIVAALWGNFIGAKGAAGSALNVKSYNAVAPIGGGQAVTAEYESGGATGIDYVETLQNKGTIAAAQTSKDDAALTTNGIRGYLHAFEVLAGTPIYVLEHSTAPASGFAALLTFTGKTARGAEVRAAAGTVNRYLRINVSGGSAIVWMGYRRLALGE